VRLKEGGGYFSPSSDVSGEGPAGGQPSGSAPLASSRTLAASSFWVRARSSWEDLGRLAVGVEDEDEIGASSRATAKSARVSSAMGAEELVVHEVHAAVVEIGAQESDVVLHG